MVGRKHAINDRLYFLESFTLISVAIMLKKKQLYLKKNTVLLLLLLLELLHLHLFLVAIKNNCFIISNNYIKIFSHKMCHWPLLATDKIILKYNFNAIVYIYIYASRKQNFSFDRAVAYTR